MLEEWVGANTGSKSGSRVFDESFALSINRSIFSPGVKEIALRRDVEDETIRWQADLQ